MLAILIGAAGVAVGVLIAGVVGSLQADSPEWFLIALPFSILALAGAATSWTLLKRGRGAAAIGAIALFVAVGVAHGAGPYITKRNEDESAKPFCMEVLRYLKPDENLRLYQWTKPMLGVYTERFIDVVNDPEELQELFESDRQVFVVMKERVYKELVDSFPRPIHVVLRHWIDHRYVLLVSNRPADESSGAETPAERTGRSRAEGVDASSAEGSGISSGRTYTWGRSPPGRVRDRQFA